MKKLLSLILTLGCLGCVGSKHEIKVPEDFFEKTSPLNGVSMTLYPYKLNEDSIYLSPSRKLRIENKKYEGLKSLEIVESKNTYNKRSIHDIEKMNISK